MKVKYNKEVDVLLIQFKESAIKESDESKPGIIIDYAEDGSVISIEILDASKQLPFPTKVEYEVA